MPVSQSKLQTLFMKHVEGLELEILELQNNLTIKLSIQIKVAQN
jgi:hypothetical protein